MLLVDADPIEVKEFGEMLQPWCVNPVICCDYWLAARALISRRFDLALVDIDLDPHLCLEWLSRFRSIIPDLPIIAITSDDSRDREIAVRSREIAHYLVRPALLNELVAFSRHIASKKQISGE